MIKVDLLCDVCRDNVGKIEVDNMWDGAVFLVSGVEHQHRAELHDQVQDFQGNVIRRIEGLAAAFLKETGILPSECELVVQTLPDQVVYYFRRRQDPPSPEVE